MSKISAKIPAKKEKEEIVQIAGRAPKSLKDKVDKAVAKLKRSQPHIKWSFNSVLIASLEYFLEQVE